MKKIVKFHKVSFDELEKAWEGRVPGGKRRGD